MSEEEKEAIETAKTILNEWQKILDIEDKTEREIEMTCYFEEMPFYTIKALLNLINKQQKEIEILTSLTKQAQDDVKIWKGMYEELKAINLMQKYRIEVIDEREFISKDKIKAKIEELEKFETYLDENGYEIARVQNQDTIRVLKELLGDD